MATPSLVLRGAALLFGLLTVMECGAWGPHPRITEAALETLGTNHPLRALLGEHFLRLTNHCWMADYKRAPYRDVDQHFYADDYLLFPDATFHYDHICPEVKQTYRPYFRRALQALESEDAANAARWIGSLLHFVEDTGSPPHAAEIRGGPHSNMENWVDASRIRIDGYRPRLLGTNLVSATAGLVRRMDELIDFSRVRGLKVRLFAELGNRSGTMPIVLESALETSRVTADLLHTLGEVARAAAPTNHATFTGRITSAAPPGMENFPARVVIAGSRFSTLADAQGNFRFAHLPAGEFRATVFRPGNEATNVPVSLVSGRTNRLDVTLAKGAGNLVRNGDFQLRWVAERSPDCWLKTPLAWEGEIIVLQPGQRYRLDVDFLPGAAGDVNVRWTRRLPHEVPTLLQRMAPLPRIEAQAVTPDKPWLEFTGSETMALVQVSLRSTNALEKFCRGVRLVPVKAP